MIPQKKTLLGLVAFAILGTLGYVVYGNMDGVEKSVYLTNQPVMVEVVSNSGKVSRLACPDTEGEPGMEIGIRITELLEGNPQEPTSHCMRASYTLKIKYDRRGRVKEKTAHNVSVVELY